MEDLLQQAMFNLAVALARGEGSPRNVSEAGLRDWAAHLGALLEGEFVGIEGP